MNRSSVSAIIVACGLGISASAHAQDNAQTQNSATPGPSATDVSGSTAASDPLKVEPQSAQQDGSTDIPEEIDIYAFGSSTDSVHGTFD